jgi:aspartyl/glutamyl-tRNA(Asn/Gln) amidotransferase C subunit
LNKRFHATRRDQDGILDHMDQLNAVDVEDVEPMAQVLFADEADPLREDAVAPPLGNEAALAMRRRAARDISKCRR